MKSIVEVIQQKLSRCQFWMVSDICEVSNTQINKDVVSCFDFGSKEQLIKSGLNNNMVISCSCRKKSGGRPSQGWFGVNHDTKDSQSVYSHVSAVFSYICKVAAAPCIIFSQEVTKVGRGRGKRRDEERACFSLIHEKILPGRIHSVLLTRAWAKSTNTTGPGRSQVLN